MMETTNKIWIICLVGVTAFISFIVYIFYPRNEIINVTGKSWKRTIDIESYEWVNHSDWSVPPGGVIQYTTEEIYEYEKVLDHIETYQEEHQERYISGYETVTHDWGNGDVDVEEEPIYDYRTVYEEKTREVFREEPVYRTKYHYTIQEWVYNRSYTISGTENEPHWPEYYLADSDERVGPKHENYSIIGVEQEKGKERNLHASYDIWLDIETGRTYEFKISLDVILEIVNTL